MLVLPDSITHSTALACLELLKQQLTAEPAHAVLVSASGLQRFDSAALAVLLEVRRLALQMHQTFAVQEIPERLADLARLYGIAELLPPENECPP